MSYAPRKELGIFSSLFYALVIAALILLILFLKSFRTSQVMLIYFYSVFVTTFMLSRIIGSLFYQSSSKKVGKGEEPTVTFVIPSKNEKDAIYDTIRNCTIIDYPKEKFEIIAINDGSTDNTLAEMLRAKKDFPSVNIIVEHWRKNKGKREGMNFGFRKAKGEIIIQLDSDSYPAPDALRYLVAPFENPSIAIVSAHSEPTNKDQNALTKMQTAYYFMSFRALKATESLFNLVFCCPGCCSAYRKKYILPALKEFNEETFLGQKYSFGDDRSLTNHMIKRGYKTIYVANAIAYTIVPDNMKQLLKQQIRWKKSWFINTMRASRFILKRDTFVALTYFFPLLFFTILTPIVAFKAMIINPVIYGVSPLVYIFGILIVSLISFAHNRIYDGKKYGKYIFLWSILNMTILCYLVVYALVFDLKNVSWGTR